MTQGFFGFSAPAQRRKSRKSRHVAPRRRGDAAILEALERRLAMTATTVGAESAGVLGRGDVNGTQPEILVQWQAESTEAERTQALARIGVQRKDVIHTAAMKAAGEGVLEVIQVPAGATPGSVIDLYARIPQVRYAEIDQILRPQAVSNDPGYTNGSLWGTYGSDSPTPIGPPGTTNQFGSNAERAWDAGDVGSRTVYVGIIDEGVDYTHPDLAANCWVNPYDPLDGIDNDGNGYVDDVRGWDFAVNDNTTFDGGTDDHGTHVAGTIGAVGGNGQGVAGVAWQVSMISAKFLGPNGGSLRGAVMALDYLTDLKRRHGINIVASNNSWGGLTSFSKALQDATVRAAKQDILFVAAAGNAGSNNDAQPFYPAATNTTAEAGYDSVVAVTGIDANGYQIYNYGATTVDLGAPAVNIYSTLPSATLGTPGGYGSYNGTSMAAPHVTGAIALYAAKNPNSSAQQIRTALLSSTTPTADLAGKTVTGGRLNVYDFLNTIAPPEFSISALQPYLNEGQAETTPFRFSITRKGDTSGPATVNWAVSGLGSTPADGADFAGLQFPSGIASFLPGEINKTVTVEVLADSFTESPEAFAVTLSNPGGNATLGTARASSIILNDDGVTTASNPARITIQASGPGIPSPSTMSVATNGDPLTALEVTLYNVTHTWPDDIDILLVGPTGAKSLLMSDVGGANVVDSTTLTFSSLASTSLLDSGQLLSGTYRPTDFEPGDIFSNPGVPAGPYVADFSVFNGTNPNGIWSLYVQDDVSGYNGFIADGWSLSITGGQATPPTPLPVVSLAVSPAAVAEDGTANLVYTFTRTGSTASSLTVNYNVTGTATLGTDYTGIGSTAASVTFAAGAATATVTVDPTADSSVEPDETVALTLAAGTGYAIGTTAAVVGTITNDDAALPAITLAVSPASVTEDGTANLVYTFTRTGSTASSLTVNYNVTGTATLGTDYTGIGSTAASVTFAAGAATATVTVDPTADSSVEPDETVALTVAAGTGYAIGTTAAVVGTLTNDDNTPPPSTPIALPRPTLITAVDLDGNNSPGSGEGADKAFDGTVLGSYTNYGGANSGVEFTYSVPTRLSSFVITTAHDPIQRQPTSYQVYAFNSGAWQLLAAGSLQVEAAPGVDSSPVVLPDLPSFTQYRVIFPTVRQSGTFMQIGELKLFGSQSASPANLAPLSVAPSAVPNLSRSQSTPPAPSPAARPVGRTPTTAAAFANLGTSGAAGNVPNRAVIRLPRRR